MTTLQIRHGSRTLDQEQTQDERVLEWRVEQLAAAGFSGQTLFSLAVRLEIDLNAAQALMQAGCPPETAYRILQ